MTKTHPPQSKYSWLIIGITLIIVIVLIRNLLILRKTVISTDDVKQEVENLSQEVEILEGKKNQELSDFQRESIIRRELNMKKENEVIIQIPIPLIATQSTNSIASPTPPIYRQWLELLF